MEELLTASISLVARAGTRSKMRSRCSFSPWFSLPPEPAALLAQGTLRRWYNLPQLDPKVYFLVRGIPRVAGVNSLDPGAPIIWECGASSHSVGLFVGTGRCSIGPGHAVLFLLLAKSVCSFKDLWRWLYSGSPLEYSARGFYSGGATAYEEVYYVKAFLHVACGE